MCGDVRSGVGVWWYSPPREREELWGWDSRRSVLNKFSFHSRPWRFRSKSQVRRWGPCGRRCRSSEPPPTHTQRHLREEGRDGGRKSNNDGNTATPRTQ